MIAGQRNTRPTHARRRSAAEVATRRRNGGEGEENVPKGTREGGITMKTEDQREPKAPSACRASSAWYVKVERLATSVLVLVLLC